MSTTVTNGGSYAHTIAGAYATTHTQVVQLVDDLTDVQIAWQPPGTATSIAFNVWHLARWADQLHATIPGMTPVLSRRLAAGSQLWHRERLAACWMLDPATLGYAETGMHRGSAAAGRLTLSAKAPCWTTRGARVARPS